MKTHLSWSDDVSLRPKSVLLLKVFGEATYLPNFSQNSNLLTIELLIPRRVRRYVE